MRWGIGVVRGVSCGFSGVPGGLLLSLGLGQSRGAGLKTHKADGTVKAEPRGPSGGVVPERSGWIWGLGSFESSHSKPQQHPPGQAWVRS